MDTTRSDRPFLTRSRRFLRRLNTVVVVVVIIIIIVTFAHERFNGLWTTGPRTLKRPRGTEGATATERRDGRLIAPPPRSAKTTADVKRVAPPGVETALTERAL